MTSSEHPSEPSAPSKGPDAVAGDARPLLRIVKGEPSAEELAALVAVVAARGASDEARPTPKVRSRWGDPAYAVRPMLTPGPDGWRRSAFPR